MCRVFIARNEDFTRYDRKHGIMELWEHLEKEMGGHGNGYALYRGGKVLETGKGLDLAVKDIYTRTRKAKQWDLVLFHTRVASVGAKTDGNCHPYVDTQTGFALAMNGTESGLKHIAGGLGITDTEVIFRLVKDLPTTGGVITTLSNLDSVFIGCHRGIPFVVNAGGDLERYKLGKFLYASSFPKGVPSTLCLDGYYHYGDVKYTPPLKARKYTGEKGYYYYPVSSWTYGGSSGHKSAYDYDAGYEDGYTDGRESAFTEIEKAYGFGYIPSEEEEEYQQEQEVLKALIQEGKGV